MYEVLAVLYKRQHIFGYEKIVVVLLAIIAIRGHHRDHSVQLHVLKNPTTKICIEIDKNSLQAVHKSCLLRPDTGPCRADIIQYYFDAAMGRCYRFFWGGCQGNGNRFEDKKSCMQYCHLNQTGAKPHIPHFCQLSFDFGTCFGHYNRWSWDKLTKTCVRRLYSGCGGNQNNFETREECTATCLTPPSNSLYIVDRYTTCIPFTVQGQH